MTVPARHEQVAVAIPTWDADQLEVIKQRIAPGATDAELAHFAHECAHRGLDPFAGQIYAIMRWDSRQGRDVLTIQVSVAGLRTIAERTGKYAGQDPALWCGPDEQWREVWLSGDPPAACKVAVWRRDWDRPVVGVATWASYVQLDKNRQPRGLWRSAPDYMLHKCAEAAALKRAFPDEMAAAGVARELSAQSRVSMEARRVGLDDDGRHALVGRVTGGRTESSRDLDDTEILEVRGELAALADDADRDPDDGSAPAGEVPPPHVDPETGEDLQALARQLKERVDALDDDGRERFRVWLDEVGIGRDRRIGSYTTDQLYCVDGWLTIEDANGEPF